MKTTLETPWGEAQNVREIAPGLLEIDTARHGGYWLAPERWARITQLFPSFRPYNGNVGWLEEDWLELSPQLQAVAEGYSWYELDTLRQAVEVFAGLYQEHIALEESLIYPEARRQMAAEAARQA